jgi:hypothetical protein
LAKAGAIVPLADLSGYTSSTANPRELEIKVFAGADGRFRLWEDAEEAAGVRAREDDGLTAEGVKNAGALGDREESWCVTEMALSWADTASFTIHPASGNLAALPPLRSWKLCFTGVAETPVKVLAGGADTAADTAYDHSTHTLVVMIPDTAVSTAITVELGGARLAANRIEEDVFTLLNRAQIEFQLKEQIYGLVRSSATPAAALASLTALKLEQPLFGALCEILTAGLG